MATYIENAILRVTDQASRPIAAVDQAMQRLTRTVQGFGSRPVQLRVDAGNLGTIESRLGRIESMMRRAFASPSANIGGNIASQLNQVTSAANAATAAMNRLNQAASRPTSVPSVGGGMRGMAGTAARYAAWHTIGTGHNLARTSLKGIGDAASERTLLNLTGVAVPEELTRGKSEAEVAAITRAYEASVKEAITKGAATTASKYLTLTDAGMLDVGRTAIPNMKDPTQVARAMDSFGASASALALVYRDAEKGMEASRQGYRALDQMGVAGNPDKLESYMKAWTTGIFASGRDVSAIQMAQTVSRLGGAKMGLSEDALARIIMLQDEARGQTANLIRTFQNDMVRPDKSDKMLDRAIASGVRAKDGTANFATELQEDPQMYILNRIKPIAEKFGYVTQKWSAELGKMVEMSDAEKAAQLNKILTQKMGFTSSAKTFALDTIVKEDEIRRNARTVEAQRGKLTPEALRNLIWSDPRSAKTAVQSQWTRSVDALTLAVQPLVAGTMAVAAMGLSQIANKPTGTGMALLAGGAAAMWAVNNPHIAAMGTAALAHMRAATALTTAAGRLGLSSLGGFAGPGGGLAAGAKKWGGRALGALGLGAVGFDLFAGNFGNAALGAGMLGLGLVSPIAGIAMAIAAGLDAAFNDGKITGAITGPLDKFVREILGMKPAEAATQASRMLNPRLAGQSELLRDIDHDIATRKLQLENRNEGARTKAERAMRQAELKEVEKKRAAQAEVLKQEVARETKLRALIDEGNSMKEPGKDGALKNLGAEAISRAAEATARAEAEKTQVTRTTDALGNSLTVATDSMDKLNASAQTASSSFTALAEKLSGLFGGGSKPDPNDPMMYGPPKPEGLDAPSAYSPPPGLYDGGGIGIPIDAPTSVGEAAAEPIAQAGNDAAMALGGAGSEIERAGSSAGMTLIDYAAQAGQAFLNLVSSASFNINVNNAANYPGRPPELGGSSNVAR